MSNVLLIGFGNPGRVDDGLGPALADAIEKMSIEDVTVDSNYQLTVEDSSAVADHDVVIFADASVNCKEPFSFSKIEPKADISFTTHSIEPESVLGLAYQLFDVKTSGYLLAIRGYEFNEFGERLSPQAQNNLLDAVKFIEEILQSKKFD